MMTHRASLVDRRSWCCSHDSGRLPITLSCPRPPASVRADPAPGPGCCCCQCRSDRTSRSCSASSRTSCDCEAKTPGHGDSCDGED